MYNRISYNYIDTRYKSLNSGNYLNPLKDFLQEYHIEITESSVPRNISEKTMEEKRHTLPRYKEEEGQEHRENNNQERVTCKVFMEVKPHKTVTVTINDQDLVFNFSSKSIKFTVTMDEVDKRSVKEIEDHILPLFNKRREFLSLVPENNEKPDVSFKEKMKIFIQKNIHNTFESINFIVLDNNKPNEGLWLSYRVKTIQERAVMETQGFVSIDREEESEAVQMILPYLLEKNLYDMLRIVWETVSDDAELEMGNLFGVGSKSKEHHESHHIHEDEWKKKKEYMRNPLHEHHRGNGGRKENVEDIKERGEEHHAKYMLPPTYHEEIHEHPSNVVSKRETKSLTHSGLHHSHHQHSQYSTSEIHPGHHHTVHHHKDIKSEEEEEPPRVYSGSNHPRPPPRIEENPQEKIIPTSPVEHSSAVPQLTLQNISPSQSEPSLTITSQQPNPPAEIPQIQHGTPQEREPTRVYLVNKKGKYHLTTSCPILQNRDVSSLICEDIQNPDESNICMRCKPPAK